MPSVQECRALVVAVFPSSLSTQAPQNRRPIKVGEVHGEVHIPPTRNMSLEIYRELALVEASKKEHLYAIASDGDYLEGERRR